MVAKQKTGTVKLPLEEYHKLHEFYEKMHQPEMVCRISSNRVSASYYQDVVSFISLTEAQDEIITFNQTLDKQLIETNIKVSNQRDKIVADSVKYNKLMTHASEMLTDLVKLKLSSVWEFRRWRKNKTVDKNQLKSIESSPGPY